MIIKFLFPLILIPSMCYGAAYKDLAHAAIERTQHQVAYTPDYVKIAYPMGDVPSNTGVCTDVVIRSYRAFGIDLQQLVHEDMKVNFSKYPKLWALKRTDSNVDHRRVPNLRVFFKRFGESLKVTKSYKDYHPGDIVTWNLRSDGGSLPHIGIVSDVKNADGNGYMLVHNIGAGPQLEDVLFTYKITGHYRYGFKS